MTNNASGANQNYRRDKNNIYGSSLCVRPLSFIISFHIQSIPILIVELKKLRLRKIK